MKTNRTAEASYRRQQLAELLRTVRALRHEQMSPEQKLEKFNAAVTAAGDATRFIRLAVAESAVLDEATSLRSVLDKRLLRQAEYADNLQPA